MPVDLSVFDRIKTKEDYDRLNEEFRLRKQVAQAQLLKTRELDVDKLGERAFMKAAMGQELSPQESAAAQVLDAKSGGIQFNPVTGAMLQKLRLSERISIGGGERPNNAPRPSEPSNFQNSMMNPMGGLGSGDFLADMGVTQPGVAPAAGGQSEWDLEYQRQMRALAGNPKAQQDLTTAYAKSKISMTDSEAKNAGYADRFRMAEPNLTDPEKIKAYSSSMQRALDFINPFGDHLNSDEYRSYNQARRDATAAKLRQESGAVINDSEYKNDDQMLYPQVNDSAELIEQKRRSRETVINSLSRAAGPAYRPVQPMMPPQKQDAPTKVNPANIPMKAVQELRVDQDPNARENFDAVFGRGASDMVLGKAK